MNTRRGTSAVEFGMTLPFLVALISGTIEWGYFLTREAILVQVARDAASAGARTRLADDPATAARNRCVEGVSEAGFDSASATVTTALTRPTVGYTVSVSVTMPYVPLTGLIPAPAQLAASATMKMEAL